MEECFNYWKAIEYYKTQGHSQEEAEELAYKDLMRIFKKACEIIDSR